MSDGLQNKSYGYWKPLWQTCGAKAILREEFEAIRKLRAACNFKAEDLVPILNEKGEKYLRLRVYKCTEDKRKMYTYAFFGPVAVFNTHIFFADYKRGIINRNGKENTAIGGRKELVTQIISRYEEILDAHDAELKENRKWWEKLADEN